jgi:hypothetical protein
MAPRDAPNFISRKGIAGLADLSVDRIRQMYDAGELPPVEGWHVDVDLARPLWHIDTIEQWVRERWAEEERRRADRSAAEKLTAPPEPAPSKLAPFPVAPDQRPGCYFGSMRRSGPVSPEEFDAFLAEAPGIASTTDPDGITRLWPNGGPEEEPWQPSIPQED